MFARPVIALIAWTGLFADCAMGQAGVTNSSPVVKIISPANKTLVHWNSDVPYRILVTDKEDGNSDYDEIAEHEVLLSVIYIPDTTEAKHFRDNAVAEEPHALSIMKASTCLNCHASRSTLIGPSFDRIMKRYPYTEEIVSALALKVSQGSKGTWSEVPMPPNPDLKSDEIKEIVRWILKNNGNPDIFYLSGPKGSLRIKEKNDQNSGKGIYFLTASYYDHGLPGAKGEVKRGTHSIILVPAN